MGRHRPRRRNRLGPLAQVGLSALAGVILAWLAIVWFHEQVRPMLIEETQSKLLSTLIQTVNRAVTEEMTSGSADFENLILLTQDAEGNVTSLRTDPTLLSRLRRRVVVDTEEALLALRDSEITIPVGDLTRMVFFHGQGAGIPVELLSFESFEAEFESEFESVGINQSRYQLLLKATAGVNVLMPGGIVPLLVTTRVPIVDTILVGKVPESYAEFIGMDSAGDAFENYENWNG